MAHRRRQQQNRRQHRNARERRATGGRVVQPTSGTAAATGQPNIRDVLTRGRAAASSGGAWTPTKDWHTVNGTKSGGTAKFSGKVQRWCSHWRQPFELLDGLSVTVSAWTDRGTGQPVELPDVGFYVDDSWTPTLDVVTSGSLNLPWASRVVSYPRVVFPWRDYETPDDRRQFQQAARWILDSAAAGQRVDIGCFGAHGRTGTVLACLLVMQGMTPGLAIERVRATHCDRAVETREQAIFVAEVALAVNGETEETEDERAAWRRALHGSWAKSWGGASTVTVISGSGEGTTLTEDDADGYWTPATADERTEVIRDMRVGWWEVPEGDFCPEPPCAYPGLCDVDSGDCFLAATTRNSARKDPATRYEPCSDPRCGYCDDGSDDERGRYTEDGPAPSDLGPLAAEDSGAIGRMRYCPQ